jgi:hypothetical protein
MDSLTAGDMQMLVSFMTMNVGITAATYFETLQHALKNSK